MFGILFNPFEYVGTSGKKILNLEVQDNKMSPEASLHIQAQIEEGLDIYREIMSQK